jgi:hypothetical protein
MSEGAKLSTKSPEATGLKEEVHQYKTKGQVQV